MMCTSLTSSTCVLAAGQTKLDSSMKTFSMGLSNTSHTDLALSNLQSFWKMSSVMSGHEAQKAASKSGQQLTILFYVHLHVQHITIV